MRQRKHSILRLLIVTLLLASTSLPARTAPSANAPQQDSPSWTFKEPEGFVYYASNNEAVCRPATSDEAQIMNERDPEMPLHVINHNDLSAQVGDITITLRGTAQLDGFPAAKNAFVTAANRWISLLQTNNPITIIIDVDFGPTRFGTPYPQDVLGSTGTQALGNPAGYADVRSRLITGASAEEMSLYNALPVSPLPTDLGSAAGASVPSALLRALGSIPAVADPAGEQTAFGNPPSIGFNSNFSFDFDPSNGIDSDKIDFDAVAAHEIAHALGFASRVGTTAPLQVSVLDIFRFRPGTTLGTFPTASRILSPGGDHMFFVGGSDIPLSTSRNDGTGGDGFQASHWKNNTFVGFVIGLMDPAIAFGERQVIGENDLLAFDRFGYVRRGGMTGAPSINSLAGRLNLDTLTLTGSVSDTQGDITQAQTTMLDGSNNIVRQDAPFAVSAGGQTIFNFNFQVTGLSNLPTATRCSVVFIDGASNRSVAITADFSQADPGGPGLNKVTFSGSKMTLKGSGFSGQVQIEINGVIVATKDNTSNKKIKVNGNTTTLNIRPGANRVRVMKNSLWSDIEILTL
jgi:hypothetical protein